MQLDNKPVVVGITTDGPTIMGMKAAHSLFGLDELAPQLAPQSGVRAPEGELMYRYPFQNLEMDRLKVANPAILIAGEKPEPTCDAHLHVASNGDSYRCYGGGDIFLGQSTLRKLHLYFAFGEKMLYATAADAQ
jgi:hypothetical protein